MTQDNARCLTTIIICFISYFRARRPFEPQSGGWQILGHYNFRGGIAGLGCKRFTEACVPYVAIKTSKNIDATARIFRVDVKPVIFPGWAGVLVYSFHYLFTSGR